LPIKCHALIEGWLLVEKGYLMGMKCRLVNEKQVVLNLLKVIMADIVPSPSSVSSFKEKNILTFHK